jgi:hypothetical protein
MRLVRVSALFSGLVLYAVAAIACSKSPADVQADGCPKDLPGANGLACSQEGKTCSGGSDVRMLMCSKGKWTELNLPPMPQPQPNASAR